MANLSARSELTAEQLRKIPTRSRRYGVGKEIGGAVYLHRHYEALLGDPVFQARAMLPDDYEYTVVKYNMVSGAVSFIHSPDFDWVPEPTVGTIWTIGPQGKVTVRDEVDDPFVYHHKWLFVADDYTGFDVAESKQRTLSWIFLEGIDRKRIGRKSNWAYLMRAYCLAGNATTEEKPPAASIEIQL